VLYCCIIVEGKLFDRNILVSQTSSINFRLISLVFWILLPAILAIVYIIWQFSEDRFRTEQEALVGNAQALAAAVDAEVKRHLVAASTLAFARSSGNGDLSDFYRFTKAALEHLSGSWVVLMSANGQQLVNTLVPLGTELPTLLERNLIDKAIKESVFHVSNVVIGQIAKRPFARVVVPVKRTGQPGEFVIVAVNTDTIGRIMRNNRLPTGWLNGVIDRNGNFVARNVDHEKLVGQPASEGWRKAAKERPEGFFKPISLEREPLNMYFINSPLTGWSTAVGAAESVLWAPILKSIWQMTAFVSALIALSFVLALWVGRQIAAPMKSLERAAMTLIHGGELSLSRTGLREVDHAFSAFEVSAAALLERDSRQKLLVGELGHRIKNILTIIQATARLSSHGATNLEDYQRDFEQRLRAISRTHDLLLRGSWNGAQLKDIILDELSVYATEDLEQRVTVKGAPVLFAPSATWSICLVVHELATNAVKYGALSVPKGNIDIKWMAEKVENGERIVLDWCERDGPTVMPPTRIGFGSRLVKLIVEGELDGRAQFDYLAAGLHCTLEFTNLHIAAANENLLEPGVALQVSPSEWNS
jgi:two-component sensor histidine kinase